MDKIDALLGKVERLPTAPKILTQLLIALRDPAADLQKIVDMISFDPALTARILRICNSAEYGRGRQVDDVGQAVNRIGFQNVHRIVAVASGEQVLNPGKPIGLDMDRQWRHAVTTAFAAHFVARAVGAEEGLLFTAGLLHDLGKLPMAEVWNGNYTPLIVDQDLAGTQLAQLEGTRFGMNHAEVGARLMERWQFSPEMIASVRYHHHPPAAGGAARSAACIHVADMLAHSFDPGFEGVEITAEQADDVQQMLGLTMRDLVQTQDEIRESLKFVEAMCRGRR